MNHIFLHLRHGSEELLSLHHSGYICGGLAELPPVVRQDLGVPLKGVMNGRPSAAARCTFNDKP